MIPHCRSRIMHQSHQHCAAQYMCGLMQMRRDCRRMQDILSRPGPQRIQDKAAAGIAVRSTVFFLGSVAQHAY